MEGNKKRLEETVIEQKKTRQFFGLLLIFGFQTENIAILSYLVQDLNQSSGYSCYQYPEGWGRTQQRFGQW